MPVLSNLTTGAKNKEGKVLNLNYSVLEIMYRPQGAIQKGLSVFTKAVWPYLSHFTYQYHVERARVAGLRVEDTYDNKFFREPFIAWHVYA